MSQPYLWDKTGAPDPEIEDLERRLAPLRSHLPPLRRLRCVLSSERWSALHSGISSGTSASMRCGEELVETI